MILLALVPPAWRRVMDPRVLAHVDGDVTRVNLDPRRRSALLARYAAPTAPTAPVAVPVGAGAPVVAEASAYSCPGCGYRYEVAIGDVREGFAPGTPWSAVPDAWCCPDCGVREKVDFVAEDLA
jgi:alkane 1-monooxygenase